MRKQKEKKIEGNERSTEEQRNEKLTLKTVHHCVATGAMVMSRQELLLNVIFRFIILLQLVSVLISLDQVTT